MHLQVIAWLDAVVRINTLRALEETKHVKVRAARLLGASKPSSGHHAVVLDPASRHPGELI
jgi:hypothetical protein